eukprot:909277_1
MDCLTSLDYMDEIIRSRFVNTCLLISLCGPVLNWLYQLAPMDKYGVTLILMYFVLALAVCLFILNPAQLANKSSSNHCCQFLISLITVIALATYQITLIVINVSSTDIQYTSTYLYSEQVFYCVSVAASVFVIFYYIVTLMALCKNKEHTNNGFDLEKYIKLKSIYHQIRIRNTQNKASDANAAALTAEEQEKIENRELNRSCCYLLYQFLWPSVDKEHKSDAMITYYPSRLLFAIYLGLFAIIILFELQFEAHLWLHQQLDLLQSYIESIEGTINDEWYVLPQKAVTSLVISVYSAMIMFRAWNKKLIHMRRQRPTFRYNERNKRKYSVWYSSNLMGSITMYLVIGYIYMTITLIFLFGIFIYVYFWKITLPIYWPLAVVFVAYYIFIDNFIFKKLLVDHTGSIRKSKHEFFEKCFKLLLIINDFMNFPMALCHSVLRILSGSLFMVISYLRPDISMYPRGFKHKDMAHSAFVASIRLLIEREQEYLIRFKDQYAQHCSGNVMVDAQDAHTKGVCVVDEMDNTMDFHAL